MTSKTSLWADAVMRDRMAALRANVEMQSMLARRHKPAKARARQAWRVGSLRLAPALVAVTTLVVGVFAGTAYAYFAVTGVGTGQASVGRLQPVVVEHATATVTGLLFPGGTGTLELKVTNPNSFALQVVGVAQDGPVTVTGGGTGCTSDTGAWPTLTLGTSGVAVATTSTVASGLDLVVTAGPSRTTTLTVANGATMKTTSNTTCQGATFHIPVVVTVHA